MKAFRGQAIAGKARIWIILVLVMAGATRAGGEEFRTFNPIAAPGRIPAGARLISRPRPVDRTTIDHAVQEVMKSWNTGDLEKHLGQNLQDRTRLVDAMAEKVPRDATIRLLAIQGTQTLEQFERHAPATEGKEIVSTVSVIAATQIEFNDPAQGFRRLAGTNEFILKITESVAR